MKRSILIVAAFAFATLFCCGTDSQASSRHASTRINISHGRSINVPVFARDHRFDSHCWFGTYRCTGYYCAADQQWYYWYEPTAQFLPISLMSLYPPTTPGVTVITRLPGVAAVRVVPGVVPAGVVSGMPGLPPGASALPNGTPAPQ